MSEHCNYCGSQICNHGNCPQCAPCQHCDGGDRNNKKFYEYGDEGIDYGTDDYSSGYEDED